MVQTDAVGVALLVPLLVVQVEQVELSKLYLVQQLPDVDMADVQYTKTSLYGTYSFQLHHYEIHEWQKMPMFRQVAQNLTTE